MPSAEPELASFQCWYGLVLLIKSNGLHWTETEVAPRPILPRGSGKNLFLASALLQGHHPLYMGPSLSSMAPTSLLFLPLTFHAFPLRTLMKTLRPPRPLETPANHSRGNRIPGALGTFPCGCGSSLLTAAGGA